MVVPANYPALSDYLDRHSGQEVSAVSEGGFCLGVLVAQVVISLGLGLLWDWGAAAAWFGPGTFFTALAARGIEGMINKRQRRVVQGKQVQAHIENLHHALQENRLDRDLAPVAGKILEALCLHRHRALQALEREPALPADLRARVIAAADETLADALLRIGPFFGPSYGDPSGPRALTLTPEGLEAVEMLNRFPTPAEGRGADVPRSLRPMYENSLRLGRAADLLQVDQSRSEADSNLNLEALLVEVTSRQEAEQELEAYLASQD